MQLFALQFTQPLPREAFGTLARGVSGERQARLPHFRRWEDAHRCLFSELMVRTFAGRRLGLAPQALRLGVAPRGKPFLLDHPHVHFNVSHAGPWVVLAMGDRPVGVDVEGRQDPHSEIWDQVLSPAEWEHLRRCDADAAATFVSQTWCAKEAYAKALGLGLALPFQEVTLVSQPRPRLLHPNHPEVDPRVQFLQPDDDHWICVCGLGQEPACTLQAVPWQTLKPSTPPPSH